MVTNAAPDFKTVVLAPLLGSAMLLYGYGPGLIIGGLTVPFFASCLLVNKIRLLWNAKKLQYARDFEQKVRLEANIVHLQESVSENWHQTILFALGMIPAAGGFVAFAYLKPPSTDRTIPTYSLRPRSQSLN